MTVIPDSVFIKRADDGCVDCPSNSTTTCPKCKPSEECTLMHQTCQKCAYYKCSPIDGSTSKSTPVGGIIGGAIGGFVFLLLVAGFFYYKFVYRKKHPVVLEEDDDILMSGIESESDGKSDYTISNLESYQGDANPTPVRGVTKMGGTQERTGTRSAAANKRISSYESFTRPKTRYNKNPRRGAAHGGARRMRTRVGTYLDTNSSRHSMATTMSTTNASNILPIAYIPGVTVRPTKNNTRSIYSYETESVFSDLNTIENASIIGDVMRTNQLQDANAAPADDAPANGSANEDSTMTAIKAQPKLINVDRIEEEDEDELTDEDDTYDDTCDDILVTYEPQTDSTNATNIPTSHSTHDAPIDASSDDQNDYHHEDDADSDSDVDSDIGEITRATSVKRTQADSMPQSREVLLDIGEDTGVHADPRTHPNTHPNVDPNTHTSTDAYIDNAKDELAHLGRPTGTPHHAEDTIDTSTNTPADSFILDVEFDDSGPFNDP